MKCIYINLDAQLERRALIEASFAAISHEGHTLARFAAIASDSVADHAFMPPLFRPEAACFLSHRAVVEQHVGLDAHLFVLEDDVIFGNQTFQVIDGILGKEGVEWDIFYTDVSLAHTATVLDFIKKRMAFESHPWIEFVDLQTIPFAAASAYIINKKSIAKVAALLQSVGVLNIHIDLLYRHLIHSGQLKGFVAFPFLTSLSSLSEQSQIQPEATQYTEIAWNTLRKLLWIDRSITDCQSNLLQLQQHFFDPEITAYATIVGSFMSNKFVPK
jgi:GR25 family glycosyltransferase involved in LPS biosynthesis